MTELQEILHVHCPEMDVVDIIIDYKITTENDIIENIERTYLCIKQLTEYIKDVVEDNEVDQDNEWITENNNYITTMKGQIQTNTKEIQRIKNENPYLFPRMNKPNGIFQKVCNIIRNISTQSTSPS